MKYIFVLLKILLSYISCVLLTCLTLLLAFHFTITESNFNKYLSQQKYIEPQKTKIQNDLNSVLDANNIEASLFENYITDEMIINNDRQYISGIFKYINSEADLPVTTNAADEFENGIKKILQDYGNGFDPDHYIITQAGIDSFASLQKTMFIYSSSPIVGFETIAKYLRKLYLYKTLIIIVTIASIFMSFVLTLLIDKKKVKNSVAFILYSICASGILVSAFSGIGLWIVTKKDSILSTTYLKDVSLIFLKSSLYTGIAVFVVSQIILLLVFFVKTKKSDKQALEEKTV